MTGFVYFIAGRLGDQETRVKIGYTASDPVLRLRALQSGSPVPLWVMAYMKGDMRLEAKLHETFWPLRLHGEWFRLAHKLNDLVLYLSYKIPPSVSVEKLFLWAIEDVILFDEVPLDQPEREQYLTSANMGIWKGKTI